MFGTTASSSSAPISNKMIGLLGLALVAGTAQGHLFLQHPEPIEGPIKNPLDASGSDFPCHGAQIPTSGGEKFPIGSSQELVFDAGEGENTAVHGGGSCQISITYETDPAKLKDPASWHVIHSIEGACPSGTTGNLDGQYTGPEGAYSGALQCTDPKSNGVDCINSYNYTIPSDLKPGSATMAWTWFNKVGNREMYMNCWKAEITGGNSKRDVSDLPTMYVANLASINSQTTTEGEDPVFPDPGPDPQKGAPDAGSAAPSSAGGAPAASPSQAPAAPNDGSYNGNGGSGGMTTMPAPAAAPTSAPAPAAPSAPSVAAPAPDSSSSGSSSSGEGVSCSGDGEVVCIGTTSFGICNRGSAVAQPLAKGTKCVNGVISKRSHVRRHVGGAPHARRAV